jgi:hypothetical protein
VIHSFFDVTNGEIPHGGERFSQVLKLSKTRIVDRAHGDRQKVLQEQYCGICKAEDFRNALAHGMWDWSYDTPHEITPIRIRKKVLKRTTFTADDLESFASDLAKINFNVRYPGGLEEFAKAKAEEGFGISRRFVREMIRRTPTDDAVGKHNSGEPTTEG